MAIVELIETYDFPDEVRFRYLSELQQGNCSYLKCVNEQSSPYPILTVKNLCPGQVVIFELVSLSHHSVEAYGFGFYMKEPSKTGLKLQNGLLIYTSNGTFSQEIKFEDVGILRGKRSQSRLSKKDWNAMNLKKLRIKYICPSSVFYSKPISNERGSLKKTLTILDYAPTHVFTDFLRNDSHLFIHLKENVKSENIHVRFEDKTYNKLYDVPLTNITIIKQSIISLTIPQRGLFESEKVDFVVYCKRDSPNVISQSEWKSFHYVQSRIEKRKREKNVNNFEQSTVNKKTILENMKQAILSKNSSLTPSDISSNTELPTNIEGPSFQVYPSNSTIPTNFLVVLSGNTIEPTPQPLLYQSEYVLMNLSSPESVSTVVNPMTENSATLHEVTSTTLPSINEIDDFFLHYTDSSNKAIDDIVYETDKLEEMFSVTSLEEVYFDPRKRQINPSKETKPVHTKKSKAENTTEQPPTSNQSNVVENRCVQQIFRIPHLIAFGLSPTEILIDICKKMPECLTGEDGWGDSPLNNALLKDNNNAATFLIDMLIECNESVHFNETNNDGHSPLILLANSTCDENLVNKLLQHGADITAVDNMQRSVFHYAVCNKKEKLLDCLLQNASRNGHLNLLLQEDVYRLTPFHLATFCEECPRILERFLEYTLRNSGDPNHRSSRNGMSALHMAIVHKLYCTLKILLDCDKIDVNLPMLDGRRPLTLAIQLHYPEEYLRLFRLRNAESCEYISDSEEEDLCSDSTTYDLIDVANRQPITVDNTLPFQIPSSVSAYRIDVESTEFKPESEMHNWVSNCDKDSLFHFADGLLKFAEIRRRTCQTRLRSLYGTLKKNGGNISVVRNLVYAMWKAAMNNQL